MAEPPGLEPVPDVRLPHLGLNQHAAQGGGYRRQNGGEEQETGRAVQRRQVERGREPPRQQHGAHDLDHVDDGEGGRQHRLVSGDDLSDQDADGQHGGEHQIVATPAAGAKPDGDGDAAGAPQTGDQAGRAPIGDGDRHQYGHHHAGQHRDQRLESLAPVENLRFSLRPHRARRCRLNVAVERAAHDHEGVPTKGSRGKETTGFLISVKATNSTLD